MRVIRHESGWDVALDMVFTDKLTAAKIASRIQYAVQALVRDSLDSTMSLHKAVENSRTETTTEPVHKALHEYSGARQPQGIKRLLCKGAGRSGAQSED